MSDLSTMLIDSLRDNPGQTLEEIKAQSQFQYDTSEDEIKDELADLVKNKSVAVIIAITGNTNTETFSKRFYLTNTILLCNSITASVRSMFCIN